MNDFYFLSPLEFEMLVRPQADGNLALPSDGIIESSSDEDLIYCLNSLNSCGALVANSDGKGFDVTDKYKTIVRRIVLAKAIIRTVGMISSRPVYYYVSKEGAAAIESSANRKGKLKIGAVDGDNLVDTVLDRMEFQDDSMDDNFSDDAEIDLNDKMEAEEFIVSEGISAKAEELLNSDYVFGVVDMMAAANAMTELRLVVYRAETCEKIAVLSEDASPLFIRISRRAIVNQICSFMEAYI